MLGTEAHATVPTRELRYVQHPLVYRPASLSVPGSPPYVPSDIWQGYDYSTIYSHGINGTGTRIAIVDAYGDSSLSKDLSSFDSLTGLPSADVLTYYPDGVPTLKSSGWALETALDVEWAHAIAPGATIDLVIALDNSLGHMYDGISYVSTNLTNETVLSMSFGLSESQYPTSGADTISAHHQLFTTIASHGTSIFASSGDNGATSCCDVSYPASDPLVVAVGGTTLTLTSSGFYSSESAWSGSGAGSSLVFTKPSWQTGLGDSMRDITDVSYDADPNTGVLVVQGGREFEVGGTSAGSPQWAALAALASQAGNMRYGSLDAKLYGLSSYHQVSAGSDGFFAAGPGWNYPTGLGTPNAGVVVSGLTQPMIPIHYSQLFSGLNVTTTGSLQIDSFASTIFGTATVVGTNETTGNTVFSNNYTITNARFQNETSRLLLKVPASPFTLSVDIALTVTGTTPVVRTTVSRLVNVSGTGTVNIDDVGIVTLDYDAVLGTARYNPQADLAATGFIGISDVGIVEYYFDAQVFT